MVNLTQDIDLRLCKAWQIRYTYPWQHRVETKPTYRHLHILNNRACCYHRIEKEVVSLEAFSILVISVLAEGVLGSGKFEVEGGM